MFVRIKTTPNSPKKAVQIVESYREGNKVKQRIVRHVGTALTDTELQKLIELAEYIKANIENQSNPMLFSPEQIAEVAIQSARIKEENKHLKVDLKNLREKQRVIVGIHEVYGQIYRELGFDKVIPNPKRKPSVVKNLFHIVMGRLSNPASKLSTVNDLSENFGIKLSLPLVYKMMDAIDDRVIKGIEEKAYNVATNLFKEPIKVIFYDATTLYFESFEEDDLRQKGYSKDMKFNQTQVLLAVMVTEKGIPIGYELYEGSKYEGKTLKDAIDKIHQRYNIEDITFVADSAILSKSNIEILEGLGKKYIIGARLRGMPKDIKREILDLESYRSINNEEKYLIKEIQLEGGKRLIVTYSELKSMKDARDRQETIDRLLKKINGKTIKADILISNYGYKKYIKVKGESEIEIDEEKIASDRKWDGLHGVITNDNNLTEEEIISQYKGLWQVEETFRISKHDLRIRPIYHWTARRIKAHIAICFIALCCARYLNYRLAIQKKPMSTERIRRALNSVQLSILEDIETKNLYGIPSVIKQDAKLIYDAMGLKLSSVPFQIK